MNKHTSNYFSLLISLILSLSLLNGCDFLGSKKVSYPAEVDSKMEASFNQAERAYLKRDFDRALNLYQQYINTYPSNKLSDESLYKIGKIHFIRKNWGAVLDSMTNLQNKSPDPSYRAKAGLMAAHAAYKNTDYATTLRVLGKTKEKDLSEKLRLRYFSLYALAGEQVSMPREKITYTYLQLNDLYQNTRDPSLEELNAYDVIRKSEVSQKIDNWIVSPMTADQIPGWFSSYPNGNSKGYISYKWGKTLYESSQNEKAKKQLSYFVTTYPKNKYASSGRKLLESLGKTVASSNSKNSFKVGVLLPLSGSKASYGEAALKGIKCAAGQLSVCQESLTSQLNEVNSVELVIKDSGNTPETVASQIDQLAEEDVAAIIGPMSANLAEAASKKAQSKRIPVFPITQKTDLMKEGEYVYQMGFEARTQMDALIKQARNRGLKKFAVFYPNNSYGKEMTDAFVNASQEAGTKIVVKVAYNPEAPDFGEFAHQLKTGVNRIEIDTNDLGFQAVFIPDSVSSLWKIIPAFELRSINDIPLLGSTAWNDPRLPMDQLAKFPGSFFVDLFDPKITSGLVPNFVNAFRTLTGRNPSSLEALGFDALWAIRKAAAGTKTPNKHDIQNGLGMLSDINGVTGIKFFRQLKGPNIEPSLLYSAPQ